jgi:hypothetical protein
MLDEGCLAKSGAGDLGKACKRSKSPAPSPLGFAATALDGARGLHDQVEGERSEVHRTAPRVLGLRTVNDGLATGHFR